MSAVLMSPDAPSGVPRDMTCDGLKVGELARRTGLTVRTLHHYDAIGLVKPSGHTGSRHRLYTKADVARLQQVVSLRAIGLSLGEIHQCLQQPDRSAQDILRAQGARLTADIAERRRLLDQLEGMARLLDRVGDRTMDELLQILEMLNNMERYYTPEQLETLRQRRETIGDEAIRAAEQEWPRLIASVKAEMEAGTDPADPKVRTLALRWRELVESFTGGDPRITESLSRLWKEQGPRLGQQFGVDYDPRLFEYVGKAQAAARS